MQLLQALVFYLVTVLCAGIGLPFTSRIFASKTVALITAKPAGLLVFAYVVWLLSSFHLLDYQSHRFIVVLFLAAAMCGIFISRRFFQPEVAAASAISRE